MSFSYTHKNGSKRTNNKKEENTKKKKNAIPKPNKIQNIEKYMPNKDERHDNSFLNENINYIQNSKNKSKNKILNIIPVLQNNKEINHNNIIDNSKFINNNIKNFNSRNGKTPEMKNKKIINNYFQRNLNNNDKNINIKYNKKTYIPENKNIGNEVFYEPNDNFNSNIYSEVKNTPKLIQDNNYDNKNINFNYSKPYYNNIKYFNENADNYARNYINSFRKGKHYGITPKKLETEFSNTNFNSTNNIMNNGYQINPNNYVKDKEIYDYLGNNKNNISSNININYQNQNNYNTKKNINNNNFLLNPLNNKKNEFLNGFEQKTLYNYNDYYNNEKIYESTSQINQIIKLKTKYNPPIFYGE